MVNTNTFLEEHWSNHKHVGDPSKSWHQSKPGNPLRNKMQNTFIHRQLKRENEKKLGKCIRQITIDCKDMLKKKLQEIDAYNSTLTQNKYRKHKCFTCKKKGHISISCPSKHEEGNKAESSNHVPHQVDTNDTPKIQKATTELKYHEVIHFPTNSILKGTDQGHWDNTWYISNQIDKHLCPNLNFFRNIKEDFVVSKLKDQMKFLFTYGIGEVIIKDDGRGLLIPGVLYAPEVTLNILSTDLLEKQGFEIVYEGNRCRLVYMFNNFEEHVFNEDSLRKRHNDFLENYFESLANSEDDVIKIKGITYSTRVTSFNEFVTFLNLIKCDDIIRQEWDYFRFKFDKVVKWFYNHYLNKSLPGPIPPTINGIQVHLLDLYKLIEGLGGYLSVHFGQEFGTIGELIGLSKQDGDELKKCYIKYLDIFTSYYKTARGPNFPTKRVEVDKFSPLSQQEALAPKHTSAEFKGKEKLEHFGIILEDEEEKKSYTKPIQPQTWQQNSKAGNSIKEETRSNSSDDFTIIT